MVKKIVLGLVILFPFYICSQQHDNQKNTLSKVKNASFFALKKGAKMFAYTIGATLVNACAHEYGHSLAYHFLFKKPSNVTIHFNWNPPSFSGGTKLIDYQEVVDKNKLALVALAGPMAGLVSCWAMLKLNTFLNCYLEKRNKLRTVKFTDKPDSLRASLVKESWSILSAFNKTCYKEPLINHHQSSEFQMAALLMSTSEISNLVHSQNSTDKLPSDGDRIADSLLGEPLGKYSPGFCRNLEFYSLFGWTFAGCASVLCAHLFKRLRSEGKASLVANGKNPYTHLTLDEAKRKLEKLQEKHLVKKFIAQGKKALLAEHIDDLENN